MNIGVLYCGGCNPHFDRVALVNNIKDLGTGSVFFESLQRGKEYEAVLVVCGCNNACPSLDGVNTGKIVMIKPQDDPVSSLNPKRIINLLLE